MKLKICSRITFAWIGNRLSRVFALVCALLKIWDTFWTWSRKMNISIILWRDWPVQRRLLKLLLNRHVNEWSRQLRLSAVHPLRNYQPTSNKWTNEWMNEQIQHTKYQLLLSNLSALNKIFEMFEMLHVHLLFAGPVLESLTFSSHVDGSVSSRDNTTSKSAWASSELWFSKCKQMIAF